MSQRTKMNEKVSKNHLRLNFIFGLVLIAWVVISVTLLPWAKRHGKSSSIGTYWFKQETDSGDHTFLYLK